MGKCLTERHTGRKGEFNKRKIKKANRQKLLKGKNTGENRVYNTQQKKNM